MDIPGEENQTQARGPTRAKSVKATPKAAQKMPPKGMADKMMQDRMPHMGESVTAMKGKHVDGLKKYAQMVDEDRMPDKEPMHKGMSGPQSSARTMKMSGKTMPAMRKR